MSYVTAAGRRRRGAVVVHIVLCMTALFGIMAVALDGGMMLTERRHAQATADAAALAGAAELFKNALTTGAGTGTATTSATTTAAANGYTNDGTTSTVTVNIPPKSGTFKDQTGYVEVIVTYNQARFFSSMWGSSAIPISARAVARGLWQPTSPAILTLDPTDNGTLLTTGNGSINVTGGGDVVVDSSSSSGIQLNGKGTAVNDPGGILVAGPSPGYGGGGTISPLPSANQPTMPDPLRFLPEPSVPAAAAAPTTDPSTGVITYYPGYYATDPKFGNNNYILQPGLYYMGGGFSISGNASSSVSSVPGSGVMIFIGPSGSLNVSGQGSVTLSPLPPGSGIYAGLTFFQSRSDSTMVQITGNGMFNITGTIYAPDATVSATGNGDALGSQIIAYQVQNKGAGGGSGAINVSFNSGTVAKTRTLSLVE
jgi:hypothetical protein